MSEEEQNCQYDQIPHKWFKHHPEKEMLKTNPTLSLDFTIVLKTFTILLAATILIITLSCFTKPSDSISSANNTFLKNYTQYKRPAIVWYTNGIWVSLTRRISCSDELRNFECDVFRRESRPNNPDAYLFDAFNLEGFPLPRSRTIWGLLHYEAPFSKVMFMYEKALNLFNYSATFGRNSNVPMPLIWMGGLDIVTDMSYFVNTAMKNDLLSEIGPVLFLQSDCFTPTEREVYVKKLMEYIQVDSYGRCLNNKKLPLSNMYRETYQYHLNGEELLKFIAKYKFMIAIENCICNDYVTEKFWRTIKVGTVPIYYGSPLIRDWLPNNKSAILLEDFPTPELLSRHLHYLLSNDTAYEEHLEHKTLGLISNQNLITELEVRPYQTDLDEVVNKFECFICESLYDEKRQDNIVTKSHYDCPESSSALSLTVNPENPKLELLKRAKEDLDKIYVEVKSPDQSYRSSNMTWW